MRRGSATVIIALVLGAPAAAHAGGGAGDDQYLDPFSNGNQTQHTRSGSHATAPKPSAPAAAAAPAATSGVPAQSTRASSQVLPRTGLPVLAVLAAGLGLLGAGLTLRRFA
ncbi:MAG: hypothetical protein ACJ76Z_04355 [Thermoleophilaceae bacterium]